MSGRGLLKGMFTLFGIAVIGFPMMAQAAVGAPQNLSIVGGRYTNDTTPTFTWTPGSGATWYEYRLDGGSLTGISNVQSYTLGVLGDGWHNFTLRSRNNAGQISNEVSLSFEIDTVGPTVPSVSPSSATEDEPVTFTVKPTGEAWTTSCTLYVGSSSVGAMTGSSTGTYSKTHTFTNDGSYSVHALCVDGDGNRTTGPSRTVTVREVDEDDNEVEEGSLIKTSSSSSVYYYGQDGKRHVFPNEDVFFSWYHDFDDVVTVSSSFMSSLSIGENVTIKPGTAVVKFATSQEVYAIAEGGILRHYLTPSLLEADYGSDWSRNDLVVIPDVFYSHYSIGSVIDSPSDYDPEDTEDGVTSIDDNF